jgi:hypothetical protein
VSTDTWYFTFVIGPYPYRSGRTSSWLKRWHKNHWVDLKALVSLPFKYGSCNFGQLALHFSVNEFFQSDMEQICFHLPWRKSLGEARFEPGCSRSGVNFDETNLFDKVDPKTMLPSCNWNSASQPTNQPPSHPPLSYFISFKKNLNWEKFYQVLRLRKS